MAVHIAAFPDGGGAYAVARRHLGRRASPVAAGSLVLDYVLNGFGAEGGRDRERNALAA